jgi:hypothetical protein
MARESWSPEENEAIIADYLAMMVKSLHGERLNKAEHNRNLRRSFLPDRSNSSIEFKHRNISAALVELGYDYLDGYRPAFNIQASLREAVESQLITRPELAALIRRIVEEPVPSEAGELELEEVPAPPPNEHAKAVREWGARNQTPRIVDFAEIEARNRSLGLAGEQAVLTFEHKRLWQSGHRDLADRIEHVSAKQGDGLGFDVLSFEESGRERLIEVKTTRRAEMTPFFVSRNELEVSKSRESEYHLYRLYRFALAPKLFMLKGSLATTCRLDPQVYRAEVA